MDSIANIRVGPAAGERGPDWLPGYHGYCVWVAVVTDMRPKSACTIGMPVVYACAIVLYGDFGKEMSFIKKGGHTL